MLHMEYDITGLRGADYNPRKIADEDIQVLAKSIEKLGMIKPLIVRGDLLVAGHQRTKALRSLGVTKAPVYVLPTDTSTYDEVRFNQLHNGTDMDAGDEQCFLEGKLELGFQVIDSSQMRAYWRCSMAVVRHQIIDLISKYGPWGGVVAIQETGEVIHCAQYAMAAHLTSTPLTVYAIPEARKAEYLAFLSRNYGEFSYDNIRRQSYIQTYAQPHRIVNGERGGMDSALYMKHVIPWVEKQEKANLRILDFGSGFGDSPAYMRKHGYNLIDVELFRRVGAEDRFDLKAIHRMIDTLCDSLETKGLFDVVVCDSVLNSIDSQETEAAVMGFISGVCNPKGRLFFSGRSRERIKKSMQRTRVVEDKHRRHVEFLDRTGMTGLFRKGQWFFQKYHDREQVEEIAKAYQIQVLAHTRDTTAWQVAGIVPPTDWQRLLKAAEVEFDLPLPSGSLGRASDVKRAIQAAKSLVS